MESKTAPQKATNSLLRKKLAKKLLIVAFVIFNLLIIFWTASRELRRDQTGELPSPNFHIWLLAPAILAFVGALSLDFYKYYILIRRFTKKKDLRLAVQTVLLGRYYDNITPSAVGGQPFQIHHMVKSGIPSHYAAMIPVIGFVSTQTAFVVLSILTILFGSKIVLSDVAYAASYFGLLLYAFAPVSIIFFAIKPKAAKRIVSGFLRFLSRIHIVRHLDKTEAKTLGAIEQYADCIRRVIKNRKLLAKIMGLSFGYQMLLYSIPFLVVTAFGGSITYLSATMTAISIMTAISFIPTPGNAGAAEGSFYLVFASLGSGNAFWAMLTWRFFTYYAFIALGGLVYLEMGLRKRGILPLSKHFTTPSHSSHSTKSS
ncbi:flippase-like domain-containing protein [Candidatus Saccharibacteria bacterium]|nr:flippase-like domain-containing protein [Candidatus Saccharibacteria bacterium]